MQKIDNMIKGIGSFISHHKVLAGFVFIAFILFAFNYNNYTAYILPASEEYIGLDIGKKKEKLKALESGDTLQQEFLVKGNLFQGVRVEIGGDDKSSSKGTILAELYGEGNKECLVSKEIELESLNEGTFDIRLEKQERNVQGNQYFLHLKVKDLAKDSYIFYYSIGNGKYNDGMLVLNGNEMSSDLYFQKIMGKGAELIPMSWLMFGFTAIGLILIFWAIYKKKMKIWNIYTIMALVIGILYSLMVTPMAAPDEIPHYYTTYKISNKMMGISEQNEEHITMRKDDSEIEGFSIKPSAGTSMTAWAGLSTPLKDGNLVQVEEDTVGVMGYFYLPGALGFSIARILGLGTVPMIYLGRLMNLIAYILLVRIAIKRMPFAKVLLTIIAVSPMSMQQASSLSYDALIFGFAYLYISQCLSLIYQDEDITLKQMIPLLITGILLAPCKSGAYLPIAFLLLLLPIKKCENKKQYALFVGSILGIIVLVAVTNFLVTSAGITGTNGVNTVDWPGIPTETYAISFMWEHPLSFLRMLLRTVCLDIGDYITFMLGSNMGSNNIVIPIFWILCYLFILFIAGTKVEGEEQKVKASHKIWMCAICFGVFFLIEVAMMIGWTPTYYANILGVQGRYFLPVLPLIMLVLKNEFLLLKKEQTQKLLVLAFAVNALIVYDGITSYVKL